MFVSLKKSYDKKFKNLHWKSTFAHSDDNARVVSLFYFLNLAARAGDGGEVIVAPKKTSNEAQPSIDCRIVMSQLMMGLIGANLNIKLFKSSR